jgi:hypothetical protein
VRIVLAYKSPVVAKRDKQSSKTAIYRFLHGGDLTSLAGCGKDNLHWHCARGGDRLTPELSGGGPLSKELAETQSRRPLE